MSYKPRVFASSIITGYEEYRDAARRGIERAGGTPVLVEDEPARADSPRNACLDLVASCDVLVSVIGPRGGFRAPSGKLVVQEEFDEARRNGTPTLLLLDDVERDADGEQLARELSGWVDGLLRKTFKSPEELETEVGRALKPLLKTMSRPAQDPSVVQAAVESPDHGGGQYETVLRLAFAPDVVEEVFDPLSFDQADFKKAILRSGHDCELFAYEYSTSVASKSDRFTILQGTERGHGQGYVEVSISDLGLVIVSVQVTGQAEESGPTRAFSSTFEILKGDLKHTCSTAFEFVNRLLGQVDEHGRYGTWLYNAALVNPGMRRVVDQPANSNQGHSMGLGETAVVPAFTQPRSVNRPTFSQPTDEVQRTVALLKKRLEEVGRF